MTESRRRLQNRSLLEQHHHHNHRPKTMLHVVLAAFIVSIIICGIEGMQNGGLSLRTYARINDTFELGCYVSQSGGKLDFYDDNDIVPESFLKRVNDSYVIYTNSYSKPTKRNITCKRKDVKRNKLDNVGMSEVFVDGEIAPVNEFKCRTSDFQNLTCTFNPPLSIFTHKYHLSYAKNNSKKMKRCKLDIDDYGKRTCHINIGNDAIRAVYSFQIEAKNKIYEKEEKFQANVLESLMPKKLADAHVRISKPQRYHTSNASIVFVLPRELEKASNNLIFDVRLKAEHESEAMWRKEMFTKYEQSEGDEIILSLNNLEYANTVYQYKLRIKSKTSKEIEEMWSPFLLRSFKTNPKLPEMTAKVCENCFNVMDNGNIFLHWMDVPKYYQNGDEFSYFVRIMNESKMLLYEERVEKSMIMISKDINATALTIHIYSSNHLGLSEHHSTAHVPIEANKNLLNIKKELINEIGYKLSWKLEAVDAIDVVSYTILYCRQRNELPNQCDSSINYLDLPSNEFEFSFNTSYTYQFGVAVNRRGDGTAATGFQWAMCTASKPNEIGVVRFMWSRYVSESSISLEWKLNCADKDIVYGYNISYCTVADYDRNACQESPKHEVFYDNHDSRNVYQISSLKPYKQYNISIALISTSERIGAFSAPISVRTLEASPTAPRNLEAIVISDNEITLSWERPLEINGPSLTYELWCNERRIRIDNNQTMNDNYQYTIGNLRAFTNYSVTVVACTRNCSKPSGSLRLRTAIGKPGSINRLHLDNYDNGTIILNWQKPSILAGHLDYYLLNVTDDSESTKLYRINGDRTNCIIESFTCDKSKVYFSLRAVNVDVRGESVLKEIPSSESFDCLSSSVESNNGNDITGHFYGDLSAPEPLYCRFSYASVITTIGNSTVALIITVVFLLSVLGLFAYFLVRIYNRIQEMKDIHIVWPIGMEIDLPPGNVENYNNGKNNDDNLMKLDLVTGYSLNNNVMYSLGDIKEESCRDLEAYENTFKAKEIEQKNCHNVRDFARVPFISQSKTCEAIQNGPNEDFKRSQSMPSSPLKEAPNNHFMDQNTGYMKMYSPVRSNSSINNVAPGYCDMSGKQPIANINHANEIKSFLDDTQQNNGYIQRKSIIHKSSFPLVINSSGYVGLRNVKN